MQSILKSPLILLKIKSCMHITYIKPSTHRILRSGYTAWWVRVGGHVSMNRVGRRRYRNQAPPPIPIRRAVSPGRRVLCVECLFHNLSHRSHLKMKSVGLDGIVQSIGYNSKDILRVIVLLFKTYRYVTKL